MNNFDSRKKSRVDDVAVPEDGGISSSFSQSSISSVKDPCPRKAHNGMSVSTILKSAAQIQHYMAVPQWDVYQVAQEKCAIAIRNVPPRTTSNDLTMFVQRRIQLAFKELVSDITVVSCHVFEQGGEAIMEFQDRRLAIRALSLKNKCFKGRDLEFFPWKKRQASSFDDSKEAFSIDCDTNSSASSRYQRSPTNHGPNAVYITNLPKKITAQQLRFFLTEMMKVAYKEIPVVLACNVCAGRGDAYIEFENYEQVNRAVNLRNRVFEGSQLNIVPWDPKLLSMNWSEKETTKQPCLIRLLDKGIKQDASLSESGLRLQDNVDVKQDNFLDQVANPVAMLRQNEASHTDKAMSLSLMDENKAPINEDKMANILKRQLDAMRLDRDHWKCAHDESQERLKEVTAELASARAKALVQQDQTNISSERQLREKLAETERRFCQVAQSLSAQTNTLNAVIQENHKLKAKFNGK